MICCDYHKECVHHSHWYSIVMLGQKDQKEKLCGLPLILLDKGLLESIILFGSLESTYHITYYNREDDGAFIYCRTDREVMGFNTLF